MKAFVVDGSQRHFAEVIIDYRVSGREVMVASYGFGVKQVQLLLGAFRRVLLVADNSHSQLNPNAWKTIVAMAREMPRFVFNPIPIHAKLALIDNEMLIFTSANLSANRRLESYLAARMDEVDGVEELKKIMGNPGMVFAPADDDDLTCDLKALMERLG